MKNVHWKWIPSTLCDDLARFFFHLVETSDFFGFFRDLKISSSVLFTFKDILLALIHWTRLERSKLIVLFNFFIEWLAYEKLESSAKWYTLECKIAWFKSLIKSKNNSGPNTQPCSAPELILQRSDFWWIIVVYYVARCGGGTKVVFILFWFGFVIFK